LIKAGRNQKYKWDNEVLEEKLNLLGLMEHGEMRKGKLIECGGSQ
jgi:hypothetical protein